MIHLLAPLKASLSLGVCWYIVHALTEVFAPLVSSCIQQLSVLPLVRLSVQATSPAPQSVSYEKMRTWWHMWRRLSYGAFHHLVSRRPSVWLSSAKTTTTQTHIFLSHTNTHTEHDTLTYIHNYILPPHHLSLTSNFNLLLLLLLF